MSLPRTNDPFAVSAPAPATGAANLSPQERKLYEFMWQHRDRIPTLGYLISRNVLRWLFLGAALLLVVVLFYVLDAVLNGIDRGRANDVRAYVVQFAVGVFFGVLIRDWGQFQAVRKLWPFEMSVIDWPKVERLLWGEGASNDLPPTQRVRHEDAPLAAIPVDDAPPLGERSS